MQTSLGHKPSEQLRKLYSADNLNSVLASSQTAIRNTVTKNPATALLVAAAIGVIIGCMIKRR